MKSTITEIDSTELRAAWFAPRFLDKPYQNVNRQLVIAVKVAIASAPVKTLQAYRDKQDKCTTDEEWKQIVKCVNAGAVDARKGVIAAMKDTINHLRKYLATTPLEERRELRLQFDAAATSFADLEKKRVKNTRLWEKGPVDLFSPEDVADAFFNNNNSFATKPIASILLWANQYLSMNHRVHVRQYFNKPNSIEVVIHAPNANCDVDESTLAPPIFTTTIARKEPDVTLETKYKEWCKKARVGGCVLAMIGYGDKERSDLSVMIMMSSDADSIRLSAWTGQEFRKSDGTADKMKELMDKTGGRDIVISTCPVFIAG